MYSYYYISSIICFCGPPKILFLCGLKSTYCIFVCMVQDEEIYSVVMTNYLAGGGDGFNVIPTEKIRQLQVVKGIE